MTAKEYLRQMRKYKIQAQNKRIQYMTALENLRFLQGIDYAKDKVQTTVTDTLADAMAKLVDAENEALEAIDKSTKLLAEGITRINSLSKQEYVDVLTKRYLEDEPDKRSFEHIACEMGYTYYHVCHLHGEALQEFERKYLK